MIENRKYTAATLATGVSLQLVNQLLCKWQEYTNLWGRCLRFRPVRGRRYLNARASCNSLDEISLASTLASSLWWHSMSFMGRGSAPLTTSWTGPQGTNLGLHSISLTFQVYLC